MTSTLATIAVLALIVAAICLPTVRVTREVRALREARLRLEALPAAHEATGLPAYDAALANIPRDRAGHTVRADLMYRAAQDGLREVAAS